MKSPFLRKLNLQKKIEFTIPVGIYATSVKIIITPYAEVLTTVCKRVTGEDIDRDIKGISGCVIRREGRPIILWLPKPPETVTDFSILSHEISHVVFGILGRTGMTLSVDSEKAYAYLIKHITSSFLIKLYK